MIYYPLLMVSRFDLIIFKLQQILMSFPKVLLAVLLIVATQNKLVAH